jgi:rhomboid protease GluP
MEMRKKFRITPTTILVISNVFVYIFTSIVGGNIIKTDHSALIQFGQYNRYVFDGQYWQLFTSMFVHVDLIHLALNMLFLIIFGLRAEELFRTEEYFTVYLLSGLAGNILTLMFMPVFTISAGASGAIFGMYGASIIYMRKTFGQSILGALLYSFILLMLTTGGDVNIIAHFGGLASGLIMGYLLAKSHMDRFWIQEY